LSHPVYVCVHVCMYACLLIQYTEELTWLTMSDVERGVYNMRGWSLMEQQLLCCHLQLVERLWQMIAKDLMPLDQVKDVMITHCYEVSTQLCFTIMTSVPQPDGFIIWRICWWIAWFVVIYLKIQIQFSWNLAHISAVRIFKILNRSD